MKREPTNIVFFDGVCGLCNAFVDFLIRQDKRRVLRFAPLQSNIARQLLQLKQSENFASVVYYTKGRALYKSNAVLELLWNLGGFWKLCIGFKIIPLIVRDLIYDLIAKHRYRWFGKKSSCRLPSPEEEAYFIKDESPS